MLLPLLWQGQHEEAMEHFHCLCSQAVEVPAPVEEAVQYLETQAEWLGNYAHRQEQGYPVGGDLVERAVALVFNRRMKKQGMRWKWANATAVVALRVQQINAAWDVAAA